MSHSWKGGSTRRWRRLRAAVLEANRMEDGGRCQLRVDVMCPRHRRPCPGICTHTATQGHHSRGKAHGDNPRDIVPACAPCNSHVGNPAAYASPQPRPTSRW